MSQSAKKKGKIPLMKILVVLAIAVSGQFPIQQQSQGAVVQPKVGDCLLYPVSAMYMYTARPKIVKCSSLHNSEVYRISKFKVGVKVQDLSPIELTQFAEQVCTPWRGESKTFNAWVFRIPTTTQLEKGSRWIRCEVIAVEIDVLDSEGRSRVLSFRGKKLDIK